MREGAHQLPDKAKNKIKESNIYNKINSHNKIPKPVRRAITGVARIPLGAAKSVWKHKGKIGRTALKTLGAGTFGVMGAAAGIATGDFQKLEHMQQQVQWLEEQLEIIQLILLHIQRCFNEWYRIIKTIL